MEKVLDYFVVNQDRQPDSRTSSNILENSTFSDFLKLLSITSFFSNIFHTCKTIVLTTFRTEYQWYSWSNFDFDVLIFLNHNQLQFFSLIFYEETYKHWKSIFFLRACGKWYFLNIFFMQELEMIDTFKE